MDPDNDPIAFYEKKFSIRKSKLLAPPSHLLDEPRLSLLGKPLNYHRAHHRRDVRLIRLQGRVYNFLERPRGLPAILYQVGVFIVIFASLVLSVFASIEKFEYEALYTLFRMEILVVNWFTTELLLRLWSCGCRSRYQGCVGRFKYIKRPFCILDIITIVASIVALSMGTSDQVLAANALRGLRFFQLLRMVRMDRRGGTWKILGGVIYAHRHELMITVYFGFLCVMFASFLIYLLEKDVNPKFSNYAESLWWGLITFTTIGYGDAVPETWQGKLLSSLCAILGISFFALPAGILGSGFALKVQQQQRQKHMIRRRQPAASLIQAVWRCYAADEHSSSVVTWKRHQVALHSSPVCFKNNGSFVTRLPTIRRNKPQSPVDSGIKTLGANRVSRYARNIRDVNQSMDKFDENDDYTQLTDQHKTAIRFIRKSKYFVASRKFKEAFKPYDVKDVMEQYAAGHVDLLGRVKNIHVRLDHILGKQGCKSTDVYTSKISLASRMVKVKSQVSDIEEKLDILIKAYMEDRQRFQNLPTNTQSSETCSYPLSTEYSVNQEHSSDGIIAEIKNKTKKRVTLRSISQTFDRENEMNDLVIITPETQSLGSIPKQRPESSIILIDEYEFLEEDLNCEEEIDQYVSYEIDSNTAVVNEDAEHDCDEDTALLHRPILTTIVITPVSPVSSSHNLQSIDDQTVPSFNNEINK